MRTSLKHALIEASMPAWQVAQRAGLSETVLSRIVQGRRAPSLDERRRIAEALGRSECELFAPIE